MLSFSFFFAPFLCLWSETFAWKESKTEVVEATRIFFHNFSRLISQFIFMSHEGPVFCANDFRGLWLYEFYEKKLNSG